MLSPIIVFSSGIPGMLLSANTQFTILLISPISAVPKGMTLFMKSRIFSSTGSIQGLEDEYYETRREKGKVLEAAWHQREPNP